MFPAYAKNTLFSRLMLSIPLLLAQASSNTQLRLSTTSAYRVCLLAAYMQLLHTVQYHMQAFIQCTMDFIVQQRSYTLAPYKWAYYYTDHIRLQYEVYAVLGMSFYHSTEHMFSNKTAANIYRQQTQCTVAGIQASSKGQHYNDCPSSLVLLYLNTHY